MGNSAIARVQDAAVVQHDNEANRDLIRATYGRGLNDAEFDLLLKDAEHRGLDVVTKEVTAIKIGNGPATIMPTVHGLRKLADRSGLLKDTEGPLFCGDNGQWSEVWLDDKKPPRAAKFTVWRVDRERPIVAIVIWSERAQYKSDGGLMPTWRAMPSHMLGKVAESDAYKKARLVPDHRPEKDDVQARSTALRRVHAAAADKGLDHDGVRAVVASLVPEIASLTDVDVSAEDLHIAADLIEEFGADAAVVFADPETGEISSGPGPREAWRIHVTEAYQSGDKTAMQSLAQEAIDAGEAWRFLDMIELSPTDMLIDRIEGIATREGIQLTHEDKVKAKQARRDQRAIATEAAVRRSKDFQSLQAEAEQPTLMDAPRNPDRYGK